jgi:rubredoxin
MMNRWECDLCGFMFDADPGCVFEVEDSDEDLEGEVMEIEPGGKFDQACDGGAIMLCPSCQSKVPCE